MDQTLEQDSKAIKKTWDLNRYVIAVCFPTLPKQLAAIGRRLNANVWLRGTPYCVRNKDKAIECLAVGLKLYTEPEKSDYNDASGYASCLPKWTLMAFSAEAIWFCPSTTSGTDFY